MADSESISKPSPRSVTGLKPFASPALGPHRHGLSADLAQDPADIDALTDALVAED